MKKMSRRAYLDDTTGYNSIVRVLREKRKEQKLTQSMISKMTGYCVSNIGKFERGHINNARLILYYILILDIDINELLRGELNHGEKSI